MKELRASELLGRTVEELQEELQSLYQDQFKLNMQKQSGQQSHHDRHGKLRRSVARVKTIMRKKQIDSAHD